MIGRVDDERTTDGAGGAERVDAVQSFYGRWARVYDVLARRTPGIGRLRAGAVAALELADGDVVVDLGCGTGANLPYLRDAVGPTGTVVGVDLTGGMVDRARSLVADRGWRNVHVVQGDARRPPIADVAPAVEAGVDGVLASFVVGMLEDPASAVVDWCDLVASSERSIGGPSSTGTVVLVDAALSERPIAAPINAAFRALTVLSTPPTTQLRYDPSPHDVLRERVRGARDTLESRSSATHHREHLLGIVRVTGGRIAPTNPPSYRE
jgi:phosphatidylethanolamine/phosphatidyl-N-methylethanolamine N-methyltransferase